MNSTPIWVYVLLAFFAGAAIFVAVYESKQKEARNTFLHKQALKRNGRVVDKKFLGTTTDSKLILNHSGLENIEIYTEQDLEGGEYTYAKCKFKLSKDVKVKLFGRGGLSSFFMRYIQTGNPEFDDRFAIKANDKNFVHGFFTPKVQHKLLSLKERFLRLRITQTKLVLYISPALDSWEDYDNFIETTQSLFESLQHQEMSNK
jgi:hypothetical protein